MNDSFGSVLSKIRSVLSTHRSLYQSNERAVRTQLVEPLLKAIGWDPEDPNQVLLGPCTDAGIPDYLLVKNDRRILFVEVKNLSHDVEAQEMAQLFKYAFEHHTRYGLLTNGKVWILVVAFRDDTTVAERKVWRLDLEQDPLQTLAARLTLLAPDRVQELDEALNTLRIVEHDWSVFIQHSDLWVQPLTQAFMAFIRDRSPNCRVDEIDVRQSVIWAVSALTERCGSESMPSPPRLGFSGSQQSSLPRLGNSSRGPLQPLPRLGAAPPHQVGIDGHSFEIHAWNDVLFTTAEWLGSQGKLSQTTLVPAGSKRFLIAQEPRHPTGRSFKNPRRLSIGLSMELQYSATDCVRQARRLLKLFGFNEGILTWS